MKRLKRVITCLVAVTFLADSVGFAELAGPADKLAVHSLVGCIKPVAGVEYFNRAILDTLLEHSAMTNRNIRDENAGIESDLRNVIKGLHGVRCSFGVLRSKEKPDERALYIVHYFPETERVIAHRYSLQAEQEDPLYKDILKSHVKHSEIVQINGHTFNHQVILIPVELNNYMLSLRFPGESPRGLAKSRSYNNDPVTAQEKAEAERLISDFKSTGRIKDIDEWVKRIVDNKLHDEYPSLAGMVKFRYAPEMSTVTGAGKRVFQAYTERLDISTEGHTGWIIYISQDFITKIKMYDAVDALDMLISHELDEIETGDHNEAERRELAARTVAIDGYPMSYLDAFIYYSYANELGCKNKPWWNALQRWMTWERLRLIIRAKGNDKTKDLADMKEEIFALDEFFPKMEGIYTPLECGEVNLWKYTMDVCRSLRHFEDGDAKYFLEIDEKNFERLRIYSEEIFKEPKLRELLWLMAVFFQVGKTDDPNLGKYYEAGRDYLRGLLREYYDASVHVSKEEKERLIVLGSELAYRFGDTRAFYMGHLTSEKILELKDIEGLDDGDKEILLKMINLLTVLYTQHYTVERLNDAVVHFIFDSAENIKRLKEGVKEGNRLKKRLGVWLSRRNMARFLARYRTIIPKSEKVAFENFLIDINLFNFYRTIDGIEKKIKNTSDYSEKRELAGVLVKMFYFFMKLYRCAGKDGYGRQIDRLVFAQDNDMSEDMVNKFRHITIKDIDEIFDKEKQYIVERFKGEKEAVLLGVPIYLDYDRIVIDLYRHGDGVRHGINKMEKLLDEAVKNPDETLEGRYYDILVIVTDEFSGAEMRQLIAEAKDNDLIPKKAKVVIVSQPNGMINGNWSAIGNIMCNRELKDDEDGVQLGEYIKGKNAAVILSAGTGKRNYPMTHHGYADKGKMPGLNGRPYIFQALRQVFGFYESGRRGMVVTSNDGILASAQDVSLGKQGFQVIGATKEAIDRYDNFNGELGKLGCILVDNSGMILKFVEKPDKNKWTKELNGMPLVPVNWAYYYLSEEFLEEFAEVYGQLTDSDGNLLYIKYGLDTAKDFAESCTLEWETTVDNMGEEVIGYKDKKRNEYEKKGEMDKFKEEDFRKIWEAAQRLKAKFGIGFVDAGSKAYFKDTGTNLTFKSAAKDLLTDENLRMLLGVTEENGYRIIRGEDKRVNNIIGPNVRMRKGVEYGDRNVIVGDVIIESGRIGNDCVIIDSIVKEIDIQDGELVYGVYRPGEKLTIKKGKQLVTEVFLDKNHVPGTIVKFTDGYEAVKVAIILDLEDTAEDEIYGYTIFNPADGKTQKVFVRNGIVVGGDITELKEIGAKVIEKDNYLVYVKSKSEEVKLGKTDKDKPLGGKVWDLEFWPRETGKEGHPRADEIKVNRFSFKQIYRFTDKEAIGIFRNALVADEHIEDAELLFPYLNMGRGSGVRFATQKDKEIFRSVRIEGMKPAVLTETTINEDVDSFPVMVDVFLGQVSPSKVTVEIYYGEPGRTWNIHEMQFNKVIDAEKGRYLFTGKVPILQGKRHIEFVTRVRLRGVAESEGFIVWCNTQPDENSIIKVIQRTVSASILSKKVKMDEGNVPVWQADLDENGGIKMDTAVELSPGHPKLGQIDLKKYEEAREKLIARYNKGIFGAVSGIRVVDNLTVKAGDEIVPYAVVIEENGERYILIDIDAFLESTDTLCLILSHELEHSILGLLEENKALEELTAIYMSLQEAIEQGYKRPAGLDELGAEAQFWKMFDELQRIEKAKRTDTVIVSYAIEYMRQIPYYRELFERLGLKDEEWIKAVREAREKILAAIEIYNQFAGIEPVELVDRVTKLGADEGKVRKRLTKVAGIEVPEIIAKPIKKVKMMVSSLAMKESGIVQELSDNGKFVRLDIDRLKENPVVISWLKDVLTEVLDGRKKSPFAFFSSSNQDVRGFLKDNFGAVDVFVETEKEIAGISGSDRVNSVITLVDLERAEWNEREKGAGTMYMPLFYSVSSIYIASQVVIAGGDVGRIIDPLVRTTIVSLYAALFGDKLEEEGWNWVRLFTVPWDVLPPIQSFRDTLNSLRKAVAQIEIAA